VAGANSVTCTSPLSAMSTFVRTPGTRCASSRHTVEARTRAKSRSTCRGPVPAPPTHVMVSLEESVRAKSLICRRCALDNVVESGGKGRNTTERVGVTVVVVVVVGATVVDVVVVVVGATVVVVVVVGATVVVVDVDVVATGTIAGTTVVVAKSPPPPPEIGAAVVVGATVVVVVGVTVVVVVVVGATVVVVVGATVVVVVGATVVVVVVVVVVGAVGVTVSLVSETTPSPIALRALTRKRYDVVFVSPDTDAEVTTDTPSAKVVQLEPFVEYSTM